MAERQCNAQSMHCIDVVAAKRRTQLILNTYNYGKGKI
jgi:hypothetical protein